MEPGGKWGLKGTQESGAAGGQKLGICGEERSQRGEWSGPVTPSGKKTADTPVSGSGEMRISSHRLLRQASLPDR